MKGRVTSSELFQAERLIISTVQKEAFPELMKQLKDYKTAEEAIGNKSAPYAYKGELKKISSYPSKRNSESWWPAELLSPP